MTNKEKKAYLMRYQEKWEEIKILQEEIETLQSRAEKITSVLSDMPHGGQGDGFVSAVDKIVELKEKLSNEVLKAIDERYEIEEVINDVENTTYRRLLRRIYINGNKIVNIADEDVYSNSRVFHVHGEALKALFIKVDKSQHIKASTKCDIVILGEQEN